MLSPSEARRRLDRPTIGLLAGMGVRSTAPFLDLLIAECQRQYGAHSEPDYPPMVVFSWPTPFYPDRPVDRRALHDAIALGLQWLEACAVDLLAMPCNTAHIWFRELAARAERPLLDMVETAVKAASAQLGAGLAAQHAGGAPRVALLATRATSEAGLYQRELLRHGIETVIDEDLQDRLDRLLAAIRATSDLADARQEWLRILQRASASGADAALVGCTDLNALLAEPARDPLPIVDGTRAFAAKVVSSWRSLC